LRVGSHRPADARLHAGVFTGLVVLHTPSASVGASKIAIIPGIILMAAALALLPLAYGFPYFVISASLFGLGFGTAQPATMALLIDRDRPEQRVLATGTYSTGFDAGISIGAILLGVVSQHWGFGVMWPISAACTLLGLAGLLADSHHGHSTAQ
jgi:predicted MFS family arabinose efflux permease